MILVYSIKKAFAAMRRALALNILAAITISVILTIAGLFIVWVVNANHLLERLSRRMEITAYLEDDLPAEKVSDIETIMRKLPEAAKVEFVSKEDALAFLERGLGEDSFILEGVDNNPLPASFIITVRDKFQNPAALESLSARLEGIDGIEEAQHGGEWVRRFSLLAAAVKYGGIILGIGMVLATVLIVSTTVRLTIRTRMDEIEVMRLVGATPFFIKLPFYMEGIILGGIGALLALAAVAGSGEYLMYIFGEEIKLLFGGGINMLPESAVGGIFILGVSSGLFGSIFSLWRFPGRV